MHFHPELQWQIFLALLIDFMLWCTKLAFDGYWDPSPLWAFQLWHLEVLLGKSHHLGLQQAQHLHHWHPLASPSNKPSLPCSCPLQVLYLSLSAASLTTAGLVDPGQSFFPTYKCDGSFLYSQLMLGFHPLLGSEECSCSVCGGIDLPVHLTSLLIGNKSSLLICKTHKPRISPAWALRGLIIAASFHSQPQCRLTGPMPKAFTLSFSICSAVLCISVSSKQPVEPLPLLHPLWGQEQVIRRRPSCWVHSQTALKVRGWSLHTADGEAGSIPQPTSTHTGWCQPQQPARTLTCCGISLSH